MIRPGYTRVTDILKQWPRFSHIKPEVLEKKAEIGTNVHDAIKYNFEGIYYPLSERERPYFDSFTKWLELTKPNLIDVEERMYHHGLMITGAIDSLAMFPNSDELVLIDYKTSASADDLFWTLQAGLYSIIAKHNGKNISNRVLFVQLDKDGKLPKVHEYIITEDIVRTCLAAVTTYRYLNS